MTKLTKRKVGVKSWHAVQNRKTGEFVVVNSPEYGKKFTQHLVKDIWGREYRCVPVTITEDKS